MRAWGRRAWRFGMGCTLLALVVACGGSSGDAGRGEAAKAKAEAAPSRLAGTYWNPSEPGTGFFFERQGAVGVVTFYLFEEGGRPVWYMASGPVTASGAGFKFAGTLLRYKGGSNANAFTSASPTSEAVGDTSIVFEGDGAQVQLPGRSFAAQRFNRGGQAPAAWLPETGIFWNPDHGGRGYTIDVHDNTATVGVFHYDAAGNPIWNLVVGSFGAPSPAFAQGSMMEYRGGQTLAGPHKVPTSSNGTSELALIFKEACAGKLQFKSLNTRSVTVRRFAFGSLPAGQECQRTAPVAETVTDTTYAIWDGGFSRNGTYYLRGSPFISAHKPEASAYANVDWQANPISLKRDVSEYGGIPATSLKLTLNGDFSELSGRLLYLTIVDPDSLLSTDIFFPALEVVPPPRASSINFGLYGNSLATPGRRSGNILVYVCLDPACEHQLKGMPAVVPYDIYVGAIALDRSSIEVSGRYDQPLPEQRITVQVPPGVSSLSAHVDKLPRYDSSRDPTVREVRVDWPAAPALGSVSGGTTTATVSLRFTHTTSLTTGTDTLTVVASFKPRTDDMQNTSHRKVPIRMTALADGPAIEVDPIVVNGYLGGASVPLGTGYRIKPYAFVASTRDEYLGYMPANGQPIPPSITSWLNGVSALPCPKGQGTGYACLPRGTYTARRTLTVRITEQGQSRTEDHVQAITLNIL